eukprot:156453-Prorocentrum_minimum.AAC.3
MAMEVHVQRTSTGFSFGVVLLMTALEPIWRPFSILLAAASKPAGGPHFKHFKHFGRWFEASGEELARRKGEKV